MLTGKVAIVTGAAQGIGFGIAVEFARRGARVAIVDIDAKLGREAAEHLRESGAEAVCVRTDVASPTDVASMVREVVERFGRIDILVNNAAIIRRAAIIDITPEQWQEVFNINCTGVFLCSQAVARVMIPQHCGTIVNVTSVAAHVGAAEYASYCSTKAAVQALTRVMALEWGRYNIRANSVSPSGIETEMGKMLRLQQPEAFERRDRRTPLGRQGQVEDVAKAVMFFADDESSFVTGRDLVIDGGVTCMNAGTVE